jgi:TolB protein
MRSVTGLLLFVAPMILGLTGCKVEEFTSPVKPERSPVVTQLTSNSSVFEANPIYSPDGSWILFESDAAGNRDLWLMPADGGQPQQLTSNPGFDSAPFWSPDGTKVVFESDRTGFKNIWMLDLHDLDSGPVPVSVGEWDDADPVWSPDGTQIAHESTREKDGGTDIWVSAVDGSFATRMTTTGNGIYSRTADWSFDGAFLVFESNREENQSALYTMPAGGGAVTRITAVVGYEGHPAWSPDGTRIAYESHSGGVMEVFVIPAGGGQRFQVTTGGGFWPRWSPDGGSIVYCVFGDPEPNIWVVKVDW